MYTHIYIYVYISFPLGSKVGAHCQLVAGVVPRTTGYSEALPWRSKYVDSSSFRPKVYKHNLLRSVWRLRAGLQWHPQPRKEAFRKEPGALPGYLTRPKPFIPVLGPLPWEEGPVLLPVWNELPTSIADTFCSPKSI